MAPDSVRKAKTLSTWEVRDPPTRYPRKRVLDSLEQHPCGHARQLYG